MPSLTQALEERLRRPVSSEARRQACLHVLDWVGTVVAAAVTHEGSVILDDAAERSPGDCAVVSGPRRDDEAAAFANGALGIVLELDDVHRTARLHPGPVVIPAALATAEATGSTGEQFLDAVVRGYDAMIRVGESVGDGHYRFWHATATCGPFGAAAAAGSLRGLSAEEMVHALGNAGTQSAGLWQCRREGALSKLIHAGRAAQAGVLAARLGGRGLTGPAQILEGPFGLYAATCPDAQPDAVTAPPEDWRIFCTSLKPWPGCRHIHPAIDAALRLRATAGGDHISDQVVVRTYQTALDFGDQRRPQTPNEAAFSLQHGVAFALLRGEPNLDAFGEPGLSDREVASLRNRVEVQFDRRFEEAYPGRWGAEVAVGRDYGWRSAVCEDVRGDPEQPLGEETVRAKCADLLQRGGLAPGDADRLMDTIMALPDLTVSEFTQVLP